MSRTNKRQRVGGVTATKSAIPSSAATSNFNADNESMARKTSRQQLIELSQTPTISLAVPRPENLQKSDDLRKALEPYIDFETKEQLNHGTETGGKGNTLDIEIDLLFARLSLKENPHVFGLNDDKLLRKQNSTSNASESRRKRISMKFKRGMAAIGEIMLGHGSCDRLFEDPRFFYSYRHFIVVSVYSQTADNHLDFCRLVKSKIPLLIGNLERNQHIASAHVNPKCFDRKKSNKNTDISSSQNSSDNEEDETQTATTGGQLSSSPYCSLWFIGLQLERRKNLSLNLTEDIQKFADLVIQHGVTMKVFKEGMSIETNYIKRKQLTQYLDADFLKSERQSMYHHYTISNSNTAAQQKRISTEMLQKDGSSGSSAANAKRLRPSESVMMGCK